MSCYFEATKRRIKCFCELSKFSHFTIQHKNGRLQPIFLLVLQIEYRIESYGSQTVLSYIPWYIFTESRVVSDVGERRLHIEFRLFVLESGH